jgi:hypothetical protein
LSECVQAPLVDEEIERFDLLGGCLGGHVQPQRRDPPIGWARGWRVPAYTRRGTARPLWLPYVEVDQIGAATDHARQLGASVLLAPREGPAGWRSVISAPQCGELALWQPKDDDRA